MILVNFIHDYKSLDIIPYINIDWDDDTRKREVKANISIGWLFWELNFDILNGTN